jgi:hypothetical protein
MIMKIFNYSILILLIANSCKELRPEIVIKSNQDTIKYGEVYNAELYVQNDKNFLPAFRIIREKDTIDLPIDTIKSCAVFKAVGRSSGKKSYRGYVEYYNLNGTKKRNTFSFSYYVKPL